MSEVVSFTIHTGCINGDPTGWTKNRALIQPCGIFLLPWYNYFNEASL